jgi:vanillate O-demethylase monooxygenase subunit
MEGYVRNAWYVACWDHAVDPSKPLSVQILNERIVIYQRTDGTYSAFEDRCVHRMAPLSLGRCEGDNLRCMYHGLLFGPDGRVIEIPGQDIIPPQAAVRTYPVVERHSWIWIWMGDQAKADASLIPPAVGLADPDFILGSGYLDYEAEARLINDNLLDFSHLTFVHGDSFQAGPVFAQSLPKITPLERGIRYERWTENTHGTTFPKSAELQDQYMAYDFLIPGILLMASATFPTGSAKKFNQGTPDMGEASSGRRFTSQAVTPTGDRAARYFFSWGPHVNHGDAELRDFMMSLANKAFREDKVMIEAQQKVIDGTTNHRILPIAHDRPLTLFSRLVERLIREEQR